MVPCAGLDFVEAVVSRAYKYLVAGIVYHTDKVAPVAFLLWLGIEIFGISVVGRQDTGETCRLLAEPDTSAAVYEDVVKIVVAYNSPGRSGRVVLQVISLKIVDEESVAIAGDIIQTVGPLFYIVSFRLQHVQFQKNNET